MSLTPISPLPATSSLASSAERQLADLAALKEQLREQFHLYEEMQALPVSDREALFQILWDAQQGDDSAIEAVRELIYDEVPVGMEEFLFGRRYLNLRNKITPEKVELLMRADSPTVRRVYIAAGSGSGKSFMVSVGMSRQLYNLLCLRRPDLFYFLGPGSRISIVNLSVSKDQARDVIFAEFIARISESTWFSQWPSERLAAKARFPKRVYVFSGGSSATAYYGYHTIFGSLDEASFLADRNGTSVAGDLVEAMTKSLNSRFPRAFKLWVISTLRANDDYLYLEIERIKEEGRRLV